MPNYKLCSASFLPIGNNYCKTRQILIFLSSLFPSIHPSINLYALILPAVCASFRSSLRPSSRQSVRPSFRASINPDVLRHFDLNLFLFFSFIFISRTSKIRFLPQMLGLFRYVSLLSFMLKTMATTREVARLDKERGGERRKRKEEVRWCVRKGWDRWGQGREL